MDADPSPEEVAMKFAGDVIAQARASIYWAMISRGMLPSQGWTVSETVSILPGNIIQYEATPIPPKNTEDGKP